jgi:DNA mismatch repair protein MutS2
LKDKSLEMLEFPRIKELLAGYTSFGLSREMALAYSHLTTIGRISNWLNQSAEARHLLSLQPDFSIGGFMISGEAVILAAKERPWNWRLFWMFKGRWRQFVFT